MNFIKKKNNNNNNNNNILLFIKVSRIMNMYKKYIFFKNLSYNFIDNNLIINNKIIPNLFYTSSSCIINHPFDENKFLLNIRCVNYKLFKNTLSTLNINNEIGFTINHTLVLNTYFEPIEKFIDKPKVSNIPYIGIEDIRIFNSNNKIYYIGCIYDNISGNIKVSSDEYNIGSNYNYNIITPTFKTDFKNEKNWVFFEDDNKEMLTIYKWYPIYICKINYNNKTLNLIKQIKSPEYFKNFRGSTNGVEWENKIWFIVHTQNNFNNIKYYTHNFVILNNDLSIYGYTKQFNFQKYLVEFCIGITTRNNNFIITYSTLDSSCKLCVLSCEYIKSILIKI